MEQSYAQIPETYGQIYSLGKTKDHRARSFLLQHLSVASERRNAILHSRLINYLLGTALSLLNCKC